MKILFASNCIKIAVLEIYFYVKTASPSAKSNHPLYEQAPSKNWDPVKPPLLENLVGRSTPPTHPSKKEGSAHYGHA